MGGMKLHASHPQRGRLGAALTVVPGNLVAMFWVELDPAATLLVVRSSRFLEGLRAACDLLGFSGLQREEERLDELLPWSGNV